MQTRSMLSVAIVLAVMAAGCASGPKQPATNRAVRFTDKGYTASFQGTSDYRFDNTNFHTGGEYSVYVLYDIKHVLGTTASFAETREVRVHSVRIVQQPKAGKMSISMDQWDSQPKEVGKDFATFTGPKFPGYIRLRFRSDYIGKHQLGTDFSGTHGSDWAFGVFAQGAGLTSDDLRCKVAYQLEITDGDGAKYKRSVELELLPGDFMKARDRYQKVSVDVTHTQPLGR
ncbi:MAG: hypothetical protein AB1492_07965 [Bacillota bacterium]